MLFEIHAEKNAGEKQTFFYENEANILTDSNGNQFKFDSTPEHSFSAKTSFSKDVPLRKSQLVTTLKIQLGLSCNYSCDYCSQKFVERAPETSKKDIDQFMSMLGNLAFDEAKGLKIEFWGGEPLVYWKTLKPLVEAIQQKFSGWRQDPVFTIITNGSLLTKEICDWLQLTGFIVGISHDGPGQHLRGPDPFDDPEKKKIILDFYRAMRRHERISFNACLTASNTSRKAIHDYFVQLTGDPKVPLGEGNLVDAYDADGKTNSLQTLQQHFDFRRQAFEEALASNGNLGFGALFQKVEQVGQQILGGYKAEWLGQKCGMDNPEVLTVDLRGNVITCQNVSAVETAPNGESHCGGNITDMESVALKSATFWDQRNNCKSCPVIHACRGSCMFLDGDLWDVSCDNAYSDNVVFFALAFERITGYIPYLIKHDSLPLSRQDIFGTLFQHKEKAVKKSFPIKIVSEKVAEVDGVKVYGQAKVET